MMSNDCSIALIVDDQELFRAGLAVVLKRDLGFNDVIETGSLNEALVQLRRSSDITLASFNLELPGIETAAKLRPIREAFPNVRMVAVSASSRREDILQTLAAGFHGFILKTLPTVEVARSFQLVLDGHIYVHSCPADRLRHAVDQPLAIEEAGSDSSRFCSLTLRQQDVFDLMRMGQSNKQIARTLGLALGTVKVHVNGLFRTLGVHNRVGAIMAAPPFHASGVANLAR